MHRIAMKMHSCYNIKCVSSTSEISKKEHQSRAGNQPSVHRKRNSQMKTKVKQANRNHHHHHQQHKKQNKSGRATSFLGQVPQKQSWDKDLMCRIYWGSALQEKPITKGMQQEREGPRAEQRCGLTESSNHLIGHSFEFQ